MNARQDPDRPDRAAEDDAWRDLVARLRDGVAEPAEEGPAPAEPSAAERAASSSAPAGPTAAHDGARPERGFGAFDPLGISRRDQSPGAGRLSRGAGGSDAEEMLPGDFTPEDPEPVLAGADPGTVLAWCAALGAPFALLAFSLLWRSVPGYVVALLIAAFVAGVGVLIMRLPHSKDDDGDDGARL
ncbi:hypothetical protein [Sinomonas halotolerans]|uniref:Uncharacterized protein n=1 Tax=Sinomonas halotolerans TaxID=1644133 RepID=A0ABU9X4V8_9MICC